MHRWLDNLEKQECEIVKTKYCHSREISKSRSKVTVSFGLIFTCLLATPFAQAEGLGRLFFTPAQRAQLNSHHYLPATTLTTPTVLADVPEENRHSITVNGIVQRSGGKRTAWINGAAKTVESTDDNTSVMVNLPDQNKMVRLKVGQRITITPPAATNAEKPSADETTPVSAD